MLDINKKIKRSKKIWISNVLLSILKLKKRNKKIWIFGSWSGDKYADNSKYLFEYICKNHSKVRAIWITRSEKIKKNLLKKGYEAYVYNEKKAIELRLKAGVTFFTNSLFDIGNYDLSHGSLKVGLWHGMPLKRMHFSAKRIKLKFFKKIKWFLYSGVKMNLMVSTSKIMTEKLKECFLLKNKNIMLTGQPRNDILLNNKQNKILKKTYGIPENYKVITYMPTWRKSEKGKIILEEAINLFFNHKQLNEYLKEQDIIFLFKPHPLTIVKNIETKDNYVYLDKNDIDTQEILAITDVLITDYSSVFIDFALKEKPILFYTPDLENYIFSEYDLFFNLSELVEEYSVENEDIINRVMNTFNNSETFLGNTNKINKIYNFKWEDLNKEDYFSEKVYQKIIEYLNI